MSIRGECGAAACDSFEMRTAHPLRPKRHPASPGCTASFQIDVSFMTVSRGRPPHHLLDLVILEELEHDVFVSLSRRAENDESKKKKATSTHSTATIAARLSPLPLPKRQIPVHQHPCPLTSAAPRINVSRRFAGRHDLPSLPSSLTDPDRRAATRSTAAIFQAVRANPRCSRAARVLPGRQTSTPSHQIRQTNAQASCPSRTPPPSHSQGVGSAAQQWQGDAEERTPWWTARKAMAFLQFT